MKSSYLIALSIALLVLVWVLSGELGEPSASPAPSLAEQRAAAQVMQQDASTRVRARVIRAEKQSAEIVVRGHTETHRSVTVRAELGARVGALPQDKGDRVQAGDIICQLALDDRQAQLEEAKLSAEEAQLQYDGVQKLAERDLQSATTIATAKARLAAAQASVKARQVALEHTRIRAPFDGVIEERPVELGDYLQPGSACATLIDPNPMLLVGQVAEKQIDAIEFGDTASAQLITGKELSGRVTFIARTADANTRTYRIEIETPNPDGGLRAGLTAEIRIPVRSYMAHNVSPSLLALDDDGALGLRVVDDDRVVRFHRVEIVKNDDANGIWVTGLPKEATLITVGQELVVAGERVRVTYETSGEMPAPAARAGPAAKAEAGLGNERGPRQGDNETAAVAAG